MEYKFNMLKAVLRWAKPLLLLIVLIVIIYIITNSFRKDMFKWILFSFILLELPITILFFQYLAIDHNAYCFIDKGKDIFEYHKEKNIKKYLRSDINLIECIVPPGHAKKDSIKMYPQDEYFYYKFHFKNGDTIVITSLLLNGKLINPVNFKDLTFKKTVKLFPFL